MAHIKKNIHQLLWAANFCVCAAFSWLAGCTLPPAAKTVKWAAYYGGESDVQPFSGYEVLVFDPVYHPPLAELKARGSKVLAYLSLAEIPTYRSFAEAFTSMPGMVIGRHETWGGSIIDIRNSHWQRHLLEQQIPEILAQGFDGIMIDTIDSALEGELKQPLQLQNTRKSAVDLIKNIRRAMPPNTLLMVNRGFAILPEITQDIDIILAESILVDASKPSLHFFPAEVTDYYVKMLYKAQKENPNLKVFTLDYLCILDMNVVSDIMDRHARHGFSAYVARQDLQHHPLMTVVMTKTSGESSECLKRNYPKRSC